MKTMIVALGIMTFAFLAGPAGAAEKAAPKANNTKHSATVAKAAAWPPETITGKIETVNADKKILVVQGPDGVPFDMVVTHATRIQSGDRKLDLQQLSQDNNKPVSVRFTPERSGDIARSIRITG